MADDKSLGQTYHEEVEALKSDGISNADAVRQVAKKYGKKENAVRGGIHQYKSRHVNGGTPSAGRGRRRAPATVDDMIAQATQSLETAINLIDQEVDGAEQGVKDAEAALQAAKEHYAEVVESVNDRKADLEKKLKALA